MDGDRHQARALGRGARHVRPEPWLLGLGIALLATPPAGWAQDSTSRPRTCALPDSATTDGKLAGIVHYGSTGAAIPGAQAVLRWEVEEDDGRAIGTSRTVTDLGGRFWFCDVRPGTRVTLSAEGPDLHFGSETLVMPAGFARQDVAVRRAGTSPGGAALRVVDLETQAPVAGAAFRLSELGRMSMTDETGLIRMMDVPAGRHEFEIQRIGYGVHTGTLEVKGGHTHAVEIRLPTEPLALDPITVTMEFRPQWLVDTGFYHRQNTGLGYFLSPDDIEKRKPTRFSHLVEMDPGVRLVRTCNPRCGMVLRTDFMAHRQCSPEIYMDGKKLRLPQFLDLDDVPVWDVAAMEMYTGISETPAEFYGLCGALVIWTKRRGL